MDKPEAIVFDFDGTLVDASEAICRSFNRALVECGRFEIDSTRVRTMIGIPLAQMFTLVVPGAGTDEIDQLLFEYRRFFMPQSLNYTRLLPGVAEVLEHYGPDTKLAIATSRRSDGALRILEGFGLREYFSVIVGIEHVKDSKPHPEPIRRALEQMDVESVSSVMVGDTRHDIIAGRRAELRTVGVTTGPDSRDDLVEAGADHVLDEIGGLVHIV